MTLMLMTLKLMTLKLLTHNDVEADDIERGPGIAASCTGSSSSSCSASLHFLRSCSADVALDEPTVVIA